jgi:integrase/recombinase XerD
MAYQNKREPLNDDEVDKLVNACDSFEEKFVIFTLLDSGLRVSEFSSLSKNNIQWQEKRFLIYGKGGPYGKKTKRRIVPMSERVKRLVDHHFAFNDNVNIAARTVQRIVKRVANRAGISKQVTPHTLRHTFSINCIKKESPAGA